MEMAKTKGTSISSTTSMFTSQENAVYDRQLRVWGIHVQKRLQQAKVLLIGDNCLFSEVAKNVVLAGVGYVSLCAGKGGFNGEEGSNFLANGQSYGSSIDGCVRVLTAMNPLVSVTSMTVDALTVDAVRSFDVVCLMGGSLEDQVTMNGSCREAGIKFCCARCHGPFGWMFLDLLEHDYTSDTDPAESRSTSYNSLKDAFSVPSEHLPRKLHGLYSVLRGDGCLTMSGRHIGAFVVCWEFERLRGRFGVPSDLSGIVELASTSIPGMKIDDRILKSFLENTEEFPPMCGIMGGTMANELIKIVSFKGDPIQNFFLYDLFDGKGILHLIE